jgi:hypothetical protein
MAIGTLLEVSARIIRRHARPLLVIAALFQLPSSLVDAFAQQHLASMISPLVVGLDTDSPRILEPTAAQARSILEALFLLSGSSVFGTLLGTIATVAFTTAVLADYRAHPVTAGLGIRAGLARAIPAIVAGLLAALALLGVIVGAIVLGAGAMTLLPSPDGGGGLGPFLAILIGVCAVVLGVLVVVRLAFPGAVLAAEPGGPIHALRRSWRLTNGQLWRTFAVLALVTIVVTIIGSTLVELVASVVSDGLAAGVGLQDASDGIISALVSTLLAPIGGVVLSVLYFDLRVRHERWQPEQG